MSTLVVSACLLGRACRYDGASKPDAGVQARVDAFPGRVLPVCPEQAGGLGTPRPPAELEGGDGHAVLDGSARVIREDGVDVTDAFVNGALACLPDEKPDAALLKARSPSCGAGTTHVGGEVVPGDGVFAAMLRRLGVPVRTEEGS